MDGLQIHSGVHVLSHTGEDVSRAWEPLDDDWPRRARVEQRARD